MLVTFVLNDRRHVADCATEIADEAIYCFSKLHPTVRMNHEEWSDLKEMIQREVIGHFSDEPGVKAYDLLLEAK